MLRAIALSEHAALVEKSGSAFGAVVVKDSQIIGEGYNQVLKQNDPTWHAEIHALRNACQKLGTPRLEGCVLYTSAEPCPMCLGAAYWARIQHIYYGSTYEDITRYLNPQPFLEEKKLLRTEILREEAVSILKKCAPVKEGIESE